jgi:hypothetical protein
MARSRRRACPESGHPVRVRQAPGSRPALAASQTPTARQMRTQAAVCGSPVAIVFKAEWVVAILRSWQPNAGRQVDATWWDVRSTEPGGVNDGGGT